MGEAPTDRGTAPFVPPGLEKPAPMPKLERTVTTEPMRVESSIVPTDEQIDAFILNQRKMKANEERTT